MTPVFITGTGTGIGKTVVSAIICNALEADYWKPVQAGFTEGTDTELVTQLLDTGSKCIPELYRLSLPASPHIAARNENTVIDCNRICEVYTGIEKKQPLSGYLVIEGAGGLLVPLNDEQFIIDLILQLKARVILVSRNYLGSINHSLLTAAVCRQRGVDVLGWIFNDEYLQYEDEIAGWSGYPVIGRIPALTTINRETLSTYTGPVRENLLGVLEKSYHD